jgi:hypothetical protein
MGITSSAPPTGSIKDELGFEIPEPIVALLAVCQDIHDKIAKLTLDKKEIKLQKRVKIVLDKLLHHTSDAAFDQRLSALTASSVRGDIGKHDSESVHPTQMIIGFQSSYPSTVMAYYSSLP